MTSSTLALHHQLALWRTPKMGPVAFVKAMASPERLKHVTILPEQWKAAEKDLQWAEKPHRFILTMEDARYPSLLKQIHAFPPLLFVEGNIDLLSQPQVAMVGSRHPTAMGKENAYYFALTLSQMGFIITSGLAYGIDTKSHEGALVASGRTIAVMATGMDRVYPVANQTLLEDIKQKGCVITEFPLGVPPRSLHFPRRNRLISGLSLGVLVVEAAYPSGSLLTAQCALEQNREVFAIPGALQNPLSRGCHALLKQGAKLVENPLDITEELTGLSSKIPLSLPKSNLINQHKLKSLPDYENLLSTMPSEARSVYEQLQDKIMTPIDVIIHHSGLTAEKVSSILLLLELEGMIASVPGGYQRR